MAVEKEVRPYFLLIFLRWGDLQCVLAPAVASDFLGATHTPSASLSLSTSPMKNGGGIFLHRALSDFRIDIGFIWGKPELVILHIANIVAHPEQQ